jgi:GrpB-like predicted nucleotidyltransferase (UPF0157 family)
MLTNDSLARATSEEICIERYNPQWPVQFVAERDRLLSLLPGSFPSIEHIGSTAVAGLPAKPIIDIMAGVSAICEADALMEPLCAHGYVTFAEFNATLSDRRWLMRHSSGKRTHHLHLVIFGSRSWNQHLRFRDVLRTDAAVAESYRRLKEDLGEQFRHDRDAYTNAKTEFISEILAKVD